MLCSNLQRGIEHSQFEKQAAILKTLSGQRSLELAFARPELVCGARRPVWSRRDGYCSGWLLDRAFCIASRMLIE